MPHHNHAAHLRGHFQFPPDPPPPPCGTSEGALPVPPRPPSWPFRIGSVASVAGNASGLTVQPSRDPCTLRHYTHAPLQAVAGQLGASPQSACACSLCSLATLARRLPCGLSYAQPFACGSLLACWKGLSVAAARARAPMKVRLVKSFNYSAAPPAACGGRAHAGAPAPLTALQASPALLRARAPAACSRCPRYARANRARCARGLHYVPPEYLSSVRGGLPIQSACRGAVALTADCLGNLPPRPIVLTSTCARAPPLRLMCATRTS